MTDECEHQNNEDCMVCHECGECKENLNDEDLCFDCRGKILTELLRTIEVGK